MKESKLYPKVEKFVKNKFHCFATGVNKGTKNGRIDIIGIRDIGGDLTGKTELISVEVKAANQPFATTAGQAIGYSVYAERCYLADLRSGKEPFSQEEIAIASKLGIGLLAIKRSGNLIEEVLSSPIHSPIDYMKHEVIEKLGYSSCTICNSIFKRAEEKNWGANIKRADVSTVNPIKRAVDEKKGFVYWIWSVNERKQKNYNKHRRYICPDCMSEFYSHFIE